MKYPLIIHSLELDNTGFSHSFEAAQICKMHFNWASKFAKLCLLIKSALFVVTN